MRNGDGEIYRRGRGKTGKKYGVYAGVFAKKNQRAL